jgi:hypothetical protein
VFYLGGSPGVRIRLLVSFFWNSTNMYFIVQYRISCVSMQGSYMLEVILLQKQL